MLDGQCHYVPLTKFKIEVWENNKLVEWERRMGEGTPWFVLRVNPIIAIKYGVKDGDELEYWRKQ